MGIQKSNSDFQMHHQNVKTGKTKLCFQFNATCQKDVEDAVDKAWKEYPAEGNWVFLICNEESEHWVDHDSTEEQY